MSAIDARIDDLYKLPPDEFVSARNALAKTLTGDDAKRVKALIKPTVVPWTVNQVYWHARDIYTRLLKSGEKLRDVQLAALKGKSADLRGATSAHRQAVGDAVKAATRLASDGGVHPDADALARMFEAVSLQPEPPEPHGRFTKVVQPQGFEALAGVAFKLPAPGEPVHGRKPTEKASPAASKREAAAEARERERQEREAAAARKRHEAALKAAESKVLDAKKDEAAARRAWDAAKQTLEEAERQLTKVRADAPK